ARDWSKSHGETSWWLPKACWAKTRQHAFLFADDLLTYRAERVSTSGGPYGYASSNTQRSGRFRQGGMKTEMQKGGLRAQIGFVDGLPIRPARAGRIGNPSYG